MKKVLVLIGVIISVSALIVGCLSKVNDSKDGQNEVSETVEESGKVPEGNVAEEMSNASDVYLAYPYIPDKGIFMFVGQDLGAVGGLDDYSEGYVDYIGMPAGVTTYTNSYSLDGLTKMDNWGSGDVHGQAYLEDETFDEAMIAIGLHMVGDEQALANGSKDDLIKELGAYITAANRPVFLRIGYEFDGGHNQYDPVLYQEAFRHIVDVLKADGVENFVTVWQSIEIGEKDHLMQWYPGDDYVDWLGYSYFNQNPDEIGVSMLELAREKNKPVFIAEVTPRGRFLGTGDINDHFNEWYVPFFKHVRENKDVIKAISYINVRWEDQAMWKGQGWGDSRVFIEPSMADYWRSIVNNDLWIHGDFLDQPPVYEKNEHELAEAAGKPQGEIDFGDVLEAEKATFTGNVTTYEDGSASGGGGAAYLMDIGDMVAFENVETASDVVSIRYATQFTGSLGLYVNGERVQTFDYKTTGQWVGEYKLLVLEQAVTVGDSIGIGFDEGDQAINIDFIKLGEVVENTDQAAEVELVEVAGALEAETGIITGGAKGYPDDYASAQGGVAYIVADGDGFRAEATSAGNSVTLRYATINSGTLSLFVNDVEAGDFVIESTGAWVEAYNEAIIDVAIAEGDVLAVNFQSGDAVVNADYLLVKP